jgi:hypothetical protein
MSDESRERFWVGNAVGEGVRKEEVTGRRGWEKRLRKKRWGRRGLEERGFGRRSWEGRCWEEEVREEEVRGRRG